jgi:hypothetical protein
MAPFLEGFARAHRQALELHMADSRVADEWVSPGHGLRAAIGRGLIRIGTRLVDDRQELHRAA